MSRPDVLRGFPGILLEVAKDGIVLQSNEIFTTMVGGDARGRPLVRFVDEASTRDKLARILANARSAGEQTWELAFKSHQGLTSLRVAVVSQESTDRMWLIELPPDPDVQRLTERMLHVNEQLLSTQRELSRDRARLAKALEVMEQQNRELDLANRALDEFAHVISHDLKAPLRAVSQLAQWIHDDAQQALGTESREHLAMLQQRAALMDTMISGVLRAARAGREQKEVESVDVAQVVEEAVAMLVPDGRARVLTGDLPVIETERAALTQVITNLIGNALEHGGRDEIEVRVDCARTQDGWHFAIRDNGVGIPANLHDRVWQIFHSTKPAGRDEGSGIGLSVVKNIVERRGGRVWIESPAGGGAAFHFLWRDQQA